MKEETKKEVRAREIAGQYIDKNGEKKKEREEEGKWCVGQDLSKKEVKGDFETNLNKCSDRIQVSD